MERVVTVNASRANTDSGDEFGSANAREAGDVFEGDFGVETGGSLTATAASGNQGPCLYLGPRGERCGRPALKGDSARGISPAG